MPITDDFRARLFPVLPRITQHFATPFHIYDEAGIRATGARLREAFSGTRRFRNFLPSRLCRTRPFYAS